MNAENRIGDKFITNPVFSIHNDLLKEVEQAKLGIELSTGASISGTLRIAGI